jgi:hypothetical protein
VDRLEARSSKTGIGEIPLKFGLDIVTDISE